MGNITAMERYLSSTKVDGLKYTYTGNQLLSVNDSASNDAGYKHGTFNYNYDVNGNMTGDGSKGTSGLTVSYNILNLPKVNTLSGSTVTYTYTAAGQKLRKVSTFGTGTTTDYISGIQYSGGTIDFIQTDEGRALNLTGGTVNYEYALADHLGNTRRTFDSSTGAGTAKQVDDYMPFGMDIAVTVPSSKNNYLYNKKELQEELGLYDYGARQYDPITGRWTSIDPKADLLEMSSQYAYALNSPIVYKDKDGELPIFIGGRVGKESERASKTYWDQELLNTIANSGIPNPGGTRIFVDGDEGAEKNGDWTGNYTISSEYALSRDARELAGRMRAKEDFNTILANLEKDPRSGKIIEKIQIYTHSRGGASGVGYTDELVELIKENANLFANPDHEIDFVFNMADHQSEGQTAPDGVDEYSVHHNRDKFSGNGMKGLKGAISTDEKSPGIVGAHANSSFVKDAKAFLKAWQRNKGDSKKLINDFVSAMQANGIKVTVNE
jgi:RHS repeat-associated protein